LLFPVASIAEKPSC